MKTGWLQRAAEVVERSWRQFVAVCGSIGGPLLIDELVFSGHHSLLVAWVGGVGAAMLASGSAWYLIRSGDADRLAVQKFRDSSARLDKHFGANGPTTWHLLKLVLDELSVQGTTRISLFVPLECGPDGSMAFRLAGRYSENERLSKPGARKTYPGGQGLVTQVWETRKKQLAGGLPKDRQSWERRLVKEFHIPAEDAKKLRMQSRSLMGVLIHRSDVSPDDKVGVVLVESLEPTGLEAKHLDMLENSPLLDLILRVCDDLRCVNEVLPETASR